MILETVVIDWVSIHQALPPKGVDVIITDEKNITIGSWSFTQIGDIMWKSFAPHVYQPTQWMHLPTIKHIVF
jgi:hypothetical protein